MAEEKDDLNNLDAEEKGNGNKPSGRIFSTIEEDNPKVNLDEEIEKNIRIRTMPRKFKISTAAGDKKTTIVGAVIMIVGVLVLIAAVYLAYIFLINPKAAPAPVPKTTTQPSAPAQPANPSPATTPAKIATTTGKITPTPVATSTNKVASSTQPIIATTTAPVATTTAPFSASSTLAHDGLPPGSKVLDSDKDGLTDAEEAIFGTDPNKADTDGDGYLDGAEVLSLYNPTGSGKIAADQYIGVYADAAANFSVNYPKIWQVQNLNSGQSIIFSAADNSFIEIVSMPDTGHLSIKDWYNGQFPDTPVTDADIVAKNGWQGVFHQSRETFYLADSARNTIYTISYVPATDGEPLYYHIFLMMINSFILK
jgi:hypothetical protein